MSASFQGNEIASLQSIGSETSGKHLSRVNTAKAGYENFDISSEEGDESKSPINKRMVSFEEAEGGDGPEYEPAVSKLNSQKSFGSEPQLRRAGSHSHSMNGSESPFRSVVNKGVFRSGLQQGAQTEHRVTVDKDEEDEDEEAQRSRLKNIFKEPRTIIQDMIDMSLSKKKLVTSEKMLVKAFVEFYRGLNLLKSYRYGHIMV